MIARCGGAALGCPLQKLGNRHAGFLALVLASLRNLARPGVSYLDLDGTAPLLETGLAWRSADSTATIQPFVRNARDMVGGSE